MKATKPRPATAQWGMFLRNHDELDLGRLTDEQRQTVFDAFGPDPDMQLYDRGIRRRLAPMLDGDRRRIELAYSLLFTLPGTPVIRYGDELGMGDDLELPERNCARTPMQWSTEPHGGFTKRDKPLLPVITRRPLRLRARQRRRAAPRRRTRCSTGPSASSACARRCRRSAGATSRCCACATRPCWRCATTGATTRSSSCTISPRKPREIAFDVGLDDDSARVLVEPALRRPQLGGRGRQAPPGPRRLRLPLVPRRRAGLPPEAERDLSGVPPHEPLSVGAYGIHTMLAESLLLPLVGRANSAEGRARRGSPGMEHLTDED